MTNQLPKNHDKGPIAWMAGHSVAANLIMAALLIGGLIYGNRIKKEVFPAFERDSVRVSVAYPGASPEEVEQSIVLPIEAAVESLEGVEQIVSSAREGSGQVTVEMVTGGNLQKLTREVQSEIDRITSFPEEAEEPVTAPSSRRRQVISIIVYGDVGDHVLREAAEQFREQMLRDDRITQVDLSAVRGYEISIEASQEKLRRYNITLDELARRIRESAVDLPGGGLKTSGGEVLVRMKERRDYGHQFKDIPIVALSNGAFVRLSDIAEVKDGFEEADRYSLYNGKPAILVNIYRVGEQTPVSVSTAVMEHMEELKESLPPGIEVAARSDRSKIYSQRLDLLLRNAYLGLFLVFCLLGLFLEARLAFWVSMGIPISMLGALLFLPLVGVSINIISMFAFIVALGIVVDDAIVIGENVYQYRNRGYSKLDAAVLGAREVAQPVTFSIITNVVTFLPLYFVPGTVGKIFMAIPVVVIVVILISLFESLFILPAHLGRLSDRRAWGPFGRLTDFQQAFSRWFRRTVENVYGPFISFTLNYRYIAVAIGVAMLMLSYAQISSGRMGMTLFERIESDYALVTAVLPFGSSIDQTKAIHDRLLVAAEEVVAENGGDELAVGVYSDLGAPYNRLAGSHVASIRVYLTPPEKRPIGTQDFINLWRRKAGAIPGLDALIFRSDSGGPGGRSALTVEISHPDLGILEAAGADLAEALSSFPTVKDIDDGFQPGKRQIDFKIKPEAAALGLTASNAARQVRNAFYGVQVLRQQRGRNEVRVMVRRPKSERISEYDLEEMILRTPDGLEAPLRLVVDMKPGRAYTSINRRSGRRVVTVTADVNPPSQAGRVIDAMKVEILPKLMEKYPGFQYSFEGRQAEMNKSMKSLGMGLLLALLCVYGLLAIPFRSYIQPIIIMFSIPFGLVGAAAGHVIMGYSLSMMSLFGMVALTGVVINDSLVLIDFTNRRRSEGTPLRQAVRLAGVNRFRPILLTSLTTFGALIPMIFETSRQARFLIPMALSLGFGVLFATFITLILVPCFYVITEDMRNIFPLSSFKSEIQLNENDVNHGD